MNLKKRMIKAGYWMFSQTTIAMAGGLLKIIIIARILTPDQFGVFGIAILSLSLLESLSEMRIDQALVQKKSINDEFISTAWIISIIRGVLISLVMYFLAPLIGMFFNNPSVIVYIQFLALVPLMRGFINPNIVLFRRKLNFKKDFIINISSTFVEIFIGIIISICTRSAWGLISSVVAGAVCNLIVSFSVLPPVLLSKPKKGTIKSLMSFSGWMWVSGVATYLVNKGDDIVVGKILGTSSLGLYQNGYNVATTPLSHITSTISQITYPALSSIQDDSARLMRGYRKSFQITFFIGALLSIFTIIFSKNIVQILLGPQWISIVNPLKILVIYGLAKSIFSITGSLIKAKGETDILAKLNIFRLIILSIIILPLVKNYQLVGVSWALVLSAVLPMPYLLYRTKKLFSK